MDGQGVRGRRPWWQGDHLAQDAPAHEFRADAAARLAVRRRRRHDHEDLTAGLCMRVGMLEPREFPLSLGRNAEFPTRVEQQFLSSPLGHACWWVTDHQIGFEIRPCVRPQGITRHDAHAGSAQEVGAELGETGTVDLHLLAAAAHSHFGGDGQQQHPYSTGGIEDRSVGRQLRSEVAHSTHHAFGGHLIRSRPPGGVHEPFRQSVRKVDGLLGSGEFLYPGSDVIRESWPGFCGQNRGHRCKSRDHLFAVRRPHGLPQLDLG
jgi:hypothetical protein